jgi:hypothetical protein
MNEDYHYHVPYSKCCNCGKEMDGAGSVGGDRGPQPGDISICFYCHHLQIYGGDMRLRELNSDEMHEVAGMPEILQVMEMLKYKDKSQ